MMGEDDPRSTVRGSSLSSGMSRSLLRARQPATRVTAPARAPLAIWSRSRRGPMLPERHRIEPARAIDSEAFEHVAKVLLEMK